tara:strand:- start:1239 stop:1364 length:126 start_codon:yes stop_codon:yes gene_type:complete
MSDIKPTGLNVTITKKALEEAREKEMKRWRENKTKRAMRRR